jgi:hypothetical protein
MPTASSSALLYIASSFLNFFYDFLGFELADDEADFGL